MSIPRQLRSHLDEILKDAVTYDVPMCEHTSIKIGGPADALAQPACAEEIMALTEHCRRFDTPYFIMGNGSNLLVSDDGIRGVVIKCGPRLGGIKLSGSIIEAQSGVTLARLAQAAAGASLSGLEFAGGIPGTLGGAVYMNAGAYDGEMSMIVTQTTYLDSAGNIRTVSGSEHGFGYRKSIFSEGGCVILSSVLQLKEGIQEQIYSKMNHFNACRREKQPLAMPSCGSTFKRPQGHYAGALIQGCCLMGCSIGGAAVSEKHAGFVVNTGGATAADVRALIGHIQNEVQKKYGVTLECEVKMVGF